MNNHKHQILIVGGGPAGSACGILLAQAGLRVTICEKASFPRDKICGECINPRNWTYFELLGIADQLKFLNLNRISSFRVANSSGSFVGGQISAKPATPFFSIARSLFDDILLNQARRVGAEVFEGTLVRELFWQNGWHVMAGTAGSLRTLRADILIGADGRNSIVAKKMSDFYKSLVIGRSRTSTQDNRVGVQWHTNCQPMIGSSVEMFLFRSGYCGVVNLDGSQANVALVTTPEVAQLVKTDFPAFLDKTVFSNQSARERLQFLNPISQVLTAAPITPTSHRTSHPCAYLIGDARRTVEPFTGEGIYFALQDGVAAAMRIMQKEGRETLRVPFWSNHVYSAVLRRPRLAEALVSTASRIPSVASFGFKTIFPS